MKAINPCLALLAAAAIFVSGCASVGQDFKYSGAAALHLGQTRRSDYQATYGKPKSVSVTKNGDGDFEVSRYVYAYADLGDARARSLNIESRNGVLNAYYFISSFDADKTILNPENFKQIQRGVSTKNDVLKAAGEPHGKALCPSSMADFKDKCSKGGEVWVWTTMKPLSTLGHTYGARQIESSSVFVTFDGGGTVAAMEFVENNKNQ